MTDEMLSTFDLGEYVGQSTCEINQRPIPEVTEGDMGSNLGGVLDKWYPKIMKIILNSLEAPFQPYQKLSRLGYPSFEIREDKAAFLQEKFETYLDGAWRKDLNNAFFINNIRLQPDPNNKEREYTFIDDQARTYKKTYGLADRRRTKSGRIASRTRLVFNYPMPNLFKQILDTAIHNFLLKQKMFHHVMPDMLHYRSKDDVFALDVSHFDRTVGIAVDLRSKQIGGIYREIQEQFLELPALVVDDKYDKRYLIRPKEGNVFQLGSGDSCVAPVAKEVLLCIYCEAAEKVFHAKSKDIVSECFASRVGPVKVWNYGDDNIWFGQRSAMNELYDFISKILPVEEETPTKFLGYVYIPETGFRLTKKSYLINWYLNERSPGSTFRKFPDLGWMLRREVYSMQGEPGLPNVFPVEDRIIAKHGITASQIYDRAHFQASSVYRKGATDTRIIIGKAYQLTAEERGRLDPDVSTLPPTVTGKYLSYLMRRKS